jgi:hypothetical protein
MCCKKLLELLLKMFVFHVLSVLVINVCNQGKTLCSPCTILELPEDDTNISKHVGVIII